MKAYVEDLLENFKPGGLAKYGLDYASLKEAFPGLIYCSITGFGQTGPYAPRPGYDSLIQAMGGVMSLTGEPDGLPQKVGIPVADDFADYLGEVIAQLKTEGVRAELDHSDDRMQKKIRTHTTQKVPLMLIAGAQDQAAGTVSFRFRDGTQENGVPIADAVRRVHSAIASHALVNGAEDFS